MDYKLSVCDPNISHPYVFRHIMFFIKINKLHTANYPYKHPSKFQGFGIGQWWIWNNFQIFKKIFWFFNKYYLCTNTDFPCYFKLSLSLWDSLLRGSLLVLLKLTWPKIGILKEDEFCALLTFFYLIETSPLSRNFAFEGKGAKYSLKPFLEQ